MHKKALSFTALLAATLSLAASRPQTAVIRKIVGSTDRTEVISVELDSHIFSNTQLHWADLRVFEHGSNSVTGLEIPRIVEPLRTYKRTAIHVKHTVQVEEMRQLPDGGLALLCRLDKPLRLNVTALTIETPLKNFEQSATLLLPDGRGGWEPHGTVQALYDYSRYVDLRKNRIEFPAITNRSFKLLIGEADEKLISSQRTIIEQRGADDAKEGLTERYKVERRPFRIDKITVDDESLEYRPGEYMSEQFPLSSFRSKTGRRKKETSVIINTFLWPITNLTIIPEQQNFERPVTLSVPQFADWNTIAGGRISRTRLPGLKQSDNTAVAFREIRTERLRLLIANHDNPPLTFTPASFACQRVRYRILFIARPDCSYTLRYNDSGISKKPLYEENIIKYLRGGRDSIPWELAAPPEGDGSGGLWLKLRRLAVANAMLISSVAVAVILGLLLYNAARKMKPADEEP